MKKEVHVRVSEENYKRLKKLSKELGLSQTKIVEDYIANGRIVVVNDFIEMSRQLRYIGNNLNQLTKLCHEGRIECLNLEDVKNGVGDIWRSLNLLIKDLH